MKINSLLFLAMGFLVNTMFAQDSTNNKLVIEKGTWNLTGSIGFVRNNSEATELDFLATNSSTSFNFQPSFGYFFKNDFMGGLGLGFVHQQSKRDTQIESQPVPRREFKTNVFILNPFVRKYYGIGDHFALYLQGQGTFSTSTTASQIEGDPASMDEANSTSFSLGLVPGLTFFVSKNFALEANIAALSYRWGKFDRDGAISEDNDTSNTFNFDFSPSNISLSLAYYF
ncbi:Hypothetical protein I595_1189 [Croceitalea dokdonensis DOKDO 023]|uniref:Outer membrane protein beta-barrel domain-containing protein n=1 Tax=Croceitalea dokdonensis DOKDO 023 TaxID=1300341 RepID=A0A0P7B2Y5_9FLAO|nr:outer membrane beta-barrel protein [Croceitalea dokdonensis]KPM32762.1 Hypothetical protein I595_1189 [Croceitalea dokdonensis DOKDO 023]